MTFHYTPTDIPDPEVVPRAKRRKFSAEYKRRILEEADNCTESGQIGGLLRREAFLGKCCAANWTRENRASGMREGACGNVG